MRLLALSSPERSTELAWIEDGACKRLDVFESSGQLAESLWDRVDAGLKALDWPIDSLDGFACVRGPGSYTSLRVGLSAINGLGWSLGKPTLGFCTDELDPTQPKATSAGLLAYHQLQNGQAPELSTRVFPEYGAEFRLGGRSSHQSPS